MGHVFVIQSKPPPAYQAFRKARVILATVAKPLQLSDVPQFLEAARERLANIKKAKRP